MKKINPIDAIFVIFAILLVLLVLLVVFYKPTQSGKSVLLTVEISKDAGAEKILTEAEKVSSVYFNSSNTPVTEKSVGLKVDANGNMTAVDITLEALGDLSGGKYVFNGQVVQINQKAEIHGTYFAQGRIVEVKYAK